LVPGAGTWAGTGCSVVRVNPLPGPGPVARWLGLAPGRDQLLSGKGLGPGRDQLLSGKGLGPGRDQLLSGKGLAPGPVNVISRYPTHFSISYSFLDMLLIS
jgi:hypothetical protein